MSRRAFFENFALFADAPNGVTQLREFVLQLAVQGKLVQQDSNDEPSTECLERISTRDVGNKNDANRVSIKSEDKVQPFDLPGRWEWCCLADFGVTQTGTTPATSKAEYYGTDYPFIKPADITSDGITYRKAGLSKLGLEVGRLVPALSVLMVSIGGSIGKVGIVDRDCSCNQQINYITLHNKIVPKLFYYFLRSPYFQEQVLSRAPQTTLPILSKGKWDVIPLPLPPFEEQKRILTQVEELMRLCDELQVRQQVKRESRVRLNSAILAPLNKAASLTPEEFEQATTRLADNFDRVYDSIDTVTKLRATILQLGVEGKLVPQDPRDESAAILLERIAQQRKELLTTSELKKVDPQRLLDGAVLPFAVPHGWKWTRLGEISIKLGAGSTPLGGKNVYQREGVKFLRSQNVWNYGLQVNNVAHISEKLHEEMNGTHVEDGDILLNITGASIGRSCVVPEHFGQANVSQHVSIIRLVDKRVRFFIQLCIISPFVQESIMETQVGISREGLSMKSLKEFLLPIPPLVEQKRIVARVNQLMSLCDELEAKLRQAEADSEKLMNAGVKHVLDSVRDVSKTAEEVFA